VSERVVSAGGAVGLVPARFVSSVAAGTDHWQNSHDGAQKV